MYHLRYIKDGSDRNYLRTVATGGCVNAYDTYLAILNVEGMNMLNSFVILDI